MPVESSFSEQSFKQRIAEAVERRKQAIIANLFYIGEECLANARSNHLYLNQTGNLCSSIGYCIIADGQIVREGEWQATAGKQGNGEAGKQKGLAYLHQLATEQPTEGIVFLMSAGMDYAEYVEDMGLDVLDSSEQLAGRKIKEFMDKFFTVK